MTFSKSNYKTLLQLIKPYQKDFHTPGDGIVLRHDVDSDIEKSYRCALLEVEMGIKSTYFILNTASYYKDFERTIEICQLLQGMGHEVGWHNNAITESILTRKPILECVETPLRELRSNGIRVFCTATHGDQLCQELKYVNYNIFGYTSRQLHGFYKGEIYKLSDFGLTVEAYDNASINISESAGVWPMDNDKKIEKFINTGGRLQILTHPEWWAL
jgi:hypothetical protein